MQKRTKMNGAYEPALIKAIFGIQTCQVGGDNANESSKG
jgi:hypothetical protein